jgi:hypothetical protein
VNKIVSAIGDDDDWPTPVTFTVIISNTGPTTLDIIKLEDIYDPLKLSFESASPMPDEAADDGRVTWNDLTQPGPNGFGVNLDPGEGFVVTAEFIVIEDITITVNTALVPVVYDVLGNPGGPAQDDEMIADVPTAVDLLYFQASASGDQVLVEWATAIEWDNWGFSIYRGVGPELASAEQIHWTLGQGAGVQEGRVYQFFDASAQAGLTNYYWLESMDTHGVTEVFGPVVVDVPFQVYLPMVSRQAN